MYFIDVQGTLISDIDKTPIKGAIEFIDQLNTKNIPYILITNNTKKSSQEFFYFLQQLGFAIKKKNYIDPLMVLKDFLHVNTIAPYGTNDFLNNIQSMGYKIDFQNPEAVLVAIKPDFTNDDYAQMIDLTLQGAQLIGMHETSIYAKNGKKYPGVGAILKMIQFATQKNYDIVGKPSSLFYMQALKKLQEQHPNASFEDITIISDDVVGDLVGAKQLGMKTVFVASGKFPNPQEIIPRLEVKPDIVKTDISELL
ncbi:MAG: HAD-IIA family hydrolase [Epsilonproteobacteria bacterium]|nr:HAD-IIA family hydrolase [Campylobacterota bacterium]